LTLALLLLNVTKDQAGFVNRREILSRNLDYGIRGNAEGLIDTRDAKVSY